MVARLIRRPQGLRQLAAHESISHLGKTKTEQGEAPWMSA
jgi:hypothetical protein